MPKDYKQTIKQSLHIDGFDSRAAQVKMAPVPRELIRPSEKSGTPRIGAVLVMLYCRHNKPHVVLTKRQNNLQYHPGQISFPGGHREKNETLIETALRETREEVGISPQSLSILGQLQYVYVPASDFSVYPFVAWHDGNPTYKPDITEVAEIIEVPLDRLFDPTLRAEEKRASGSRQVTVPYFMIGAYKVWGATAMILSEFLERLQAIPSDKK